MTLSGFRIAYSMDMAQPWEMPRTGNLLTPAAATTDSMSRTSALKDMSFTSNPKGHCRARHIE